MMRRKKREKTFDELYNEEILKLMFDGEYKINGILICLNHDRLITDEEILEDKCKYNKYLTLYNEIKKNDKCNKKMLKESKILFNEWIKYHYYGEEELPKKVVKGRKKVIKTISKKEMEKCLDDKCVICLDDHKKGNSLTTSCNHSFGKCCFESWSKKCKKDGNILKCPLCKRENPTTTSFKLGKVVVKKRKLIIEEDE